MDQYDHYRKPMRDTNHYGEEQRKLRQLEEMEVASTALSEYDLLDVARPPLIPTGTYRRPWRSLHAACEIIPRFTA